MTCYLSRFLFMWTSYCFFCFYLIVFLIIGKVTTVTHQLESIHTYSMILCIMVEVSNSKLCFYYFTFW